MNRDIATFLNVTKRRENILYKTKVTPSSSNVGYVASDPLSSFNSLTIADRSNSLSGNRIEDIETSTLTDVLTFTSNTPNFVLTDVFTSDTGSTPIPLFYKHIISLDNVPRVSDEDLTLDDAAILGIEILDTFLQPVSVPALSIDNETGIVYSNFISEYRSSVDYEIYYVKYTVRIGSGLTTEIITYTDLLDSQPVYREAEFDDLTPFMTLKQDGRKVYLTEEFSSGFQITLPSISTISFKQTTASRIQILLPVPQGAQDPWYIRVTNGSFNQNVRGILYKYHLAEFLSQSFDPEPTIKFSDAEYSTIVSRTLIKTDYQNILLDDDEGFNVSITITDSNGEGIAAFTTDALVVGAVASNGKAYQKWDIDNRVGIKSIDKVGGFLDIDGLRLKSSYEIQASYYFNETHYEYTLLDFNPVSNKDILKYQVSLFIYPESAGAARSRTLYFLQIDETGKVVKSNWDDFDNETEKLISGNTLYYKDPPSYLTSLPAYDRFIEDYTVEASGINATGSFLILGDISVASPSTINELDIIDARRRGGGIIDTSFEDAVSIQPEARWYWDEGYWDGIPYPGNASYLVEVPVDIMENAGGEFRADEVTDIINRHTALGVYPAIKAYGVEVTVTGIVPRADSITLRWDYNGYPLK